MEQVDRVAALRAQSTAVLNFCSGLTEEEWRAPSKATDWTIGDLVAYMSSTCRLLLTADALRAMATRNIGRINDRFVESRRDWSREQVVEEFATWGGRAITLLDTVGRTPARSLRVPVGEVGMFPVGKFPSMLTFDWHTRLAFDMAPPLGKSNPPLSAIEMSVVVEWMLAVLAQNKTGSAALTEPITLRLTGTMDGEWLISPRESGGLSIDRGASAYTTTVEGAAADFPSWGTMRTSWRDHNLQITGDRAVAERFLDWLNI